MNFWKCPILFFSKAQSSPEEDKSATVMPPVDSMCDFLEWYESLCEISIRADDGPYEAYYKQLEDRRNECVALTNQVSTILAYMHNIPSFQLKDIHCLMLNSLWKSLHHIVLHSLYLAEFCNLHQVISINHSIQY